MIQIDGFIFLLLLISIAALCYGAGKIGFKNLWGFDDGESNSNVIKFIDGRYVKPNRKAQ
ncbi:hypothetical protein ACEN4A_05075 [Latilactobacillus sakei]|uniref:hypothetical protein n=1 Tax=Latilactobacillus sakei TaxID=1599 RepID=UPI00019CF8C0|nr:hypothetical protein [Latilactobacillus sakei]GEP20636.1 hypothetical protein LSA03nite_02240 [Latilactobacillus sakei subsp. carnosus]